MRKLTKLPREEAADNHDGLPAEGDVEGHGAPGSTFSPRLPETGGDLSPRLPGTGGDSFHRPSSGGELTDDEDVEAHGVQAATGEFSPRLPGTGGDAIRRPIGTGDRGHDDIEGDAAR
jgi:hypothetical protein